MHQHHSTDLLTTNKSKMFSKIIIFTAALAAVCAQHGQEHGHAYSSQSIVRHEVSNGNLGHSLGHQQIALQHVPVYQHAPVQVQHVAPVHYVQGHHGQSYNEEHENYNAHPKYEFEYKVEDPHTGDNKYQQESRDGDVVRGVYSLHEADGSIRTVEYTADHHSGFNALVHNSAPSQHVQAQYQH